MGVEKLQIGFQDVAFLFSRASFPPTFIKSYDGGLVFRTAICLKSVFDGNQGHTSCEILLL